MGGIRKILLARLGTNPADWKIRQGALRLVSGSRFPRGMGHDFAGVVDAIGPDTGRHKVGDEVFGISGIRAAGAFADYLVIPEKEVFAKPPSVSFEAAAALPMTSVTAWSGVVDRANVGAGHSVFIAGRLGGIGRSAVQIARMLGAEVAGNCSAAGRDEALALGVGEVADYRAFDVAAHRSRFDLVFDTAGGLSARECASMLKPGGLAVHAAPTPAILALALVSPRHAIASGRPLPTRMTGIAKAAERGCLAPKIARVVPLAEAIAAITELETTGNPKGKLVIVPG